MKRSENFILVLSMVIFSFAAWGNPAPLSMKIDSDKKNGDDVIIKAVSNDVKVQSVQVNDGQCGELYFKGIRAVVGDNSANRPVMNYGDTVRMMYVKDGKVITPCRIYKVVVNTNLGAYQYALDDYVDQHAQAASTAAPVEDEANPPSTYNDAAAAATERPTGAVQVKFTSDGLDVIAMKDVVINGVVAASPSCRPIGGDKIGINVSAGKAIHYSLLDDKNQICTVDAVSVITNYGMSDYSK